MIGNKIVNQSNFSGGGNSSNNDKQALLIKQIKLFVSITVAVVVVLSIVAFGWYQIDETEYAVVRTFGHVQVVEEPGLKFKVPFVQKVKKLPKSSLQFSIGYDIETDQSIYNESFMITEDYNFVNVDFYFEYFISDPIAYLYSTKDPVVVMRNLAQSYIRDTVGTHSVDEVLTTGKSEIQSQVKALLSERLEKENIGLQITNAVIQDSEVPTAEVAQAFKNVEDAKQGMETAINNANTDKNTRIPAANAQADKIIKNAQAQKESLIAEAEGQVARFNSLYDEYVKFPLVTKERMFYETLEDVLPHMDVYITDGKTTSMLPLDTFNGQ